MIQKRKRLLDTEVREEPQVKRSKPSSYLTDAKDRLSRSWLTRSQLHEYAGTTSFKQAVVGHFIRIFDPKNRITGYSIVEVTGVLQTGELRIRHGTEEKTIPLNIVSMLAYNELEADIEKKTYTDFDYELKMWLKNNNAVTQKTIISHPVFKVPPTTASQQVSVMMPKKRTSANFQTSKAQSQKPKVASANDDGRKTSVHVSRSKWEKLHAERQQRNDNVSRNVTADLQMTSLKQNVSRKRPVQTVRIPFKPQTAVQSSLNKPQRREQLPRLVV